MNLEKCELNPKTCQHYSEEGCTNKLRNSVDGRLELCIYDKKHVQDLLAQNAQSDINIKRESSHGCLPLFYIGLISLIGISYGIYTLGSKIAEYFKR